jgi:hypothetical protein
LYNKEEPRNHSVAFVVLEKVRLRVLFWKERIEHKPMKSCAEGFWNVPSVKLYGKKGRRKETTSQVFMIFLRRAPPMRTNTEGFRKEDEEGSTELSLYSAFL